MIERAKRPLAEAERTRLAEIARGCASLGGLAVALLPKILWIAGCTVAGGCLMLTGACVLLVGKGDGSWMARLLFAALGLLPLGIGLAILLKVANSQNNQWIVRQSRRRAALQVLADGTATLTTYRFRRAARIESSGCGSMAADLNILELESGGTLSVAWPDCFLSGDLTTGLEFVHAGPFELAVRPVGDPLPSGIEFPECDCQPEVLADFARTRPGPALPPGWRIHDEPFDALLARLRQPER